MKSSATGLFFALAFVAAAQAQTREPDWLRKPTAQDSVVVYPAEAAEKGAKGRVVLRCGVDVAGRLIDCKVEEEQPKDLGFGAAALAMTPQLMMRPALKDGKPVASSVGVPINFEPPIGPHGMLSTSRFILPTIAWAEAPTQDDLRSAYPARARKEGVSGMVALNCRFGGDRRVKACSIIKAEPNSYEFGRAAQVVARRFLLPADLEITSTELRNATSQIAVSFSAQMLSGAAPTGKPTWVALPNADAFTAAFGSAAESLDLRLRCEVIQGGNLSGCAVIRETPANGGFSNAALGLIPSFRLATWTSEGLPVVGGRVTIPLVYRVETKVEGAQPAK